MGLFDALFGPSIKERMLSYFQGRVQLMHERVSRSLREIYPTPELRDITPFDEAGSELTASANGSNEAQAIFLVRPALAGMKVITITMQKGCRT